MDVVSEEKAGTIGTKNTVIVADRKRADTSRQVEYTTDFQLSTTIGDTLLAPPFDPDNLASIREQSNILPQCIEAYVTNIARYGFEVVAARDDTPIDPEEKKELEDFVSRVNAEESFSTVVAKLVDNFEGFGYGYLEIVRDRRRRLSVIRHARSSHIRMTALGKEFVPVKYDIARGSRAVNVVENKKFRKFAQQINGETIFFKQYGDPRDMDYKTGKYATEENPVPEDRLATEILHIRQTSADPYGVPRWISQLPNVFGSRQSEIVNMNYFDDNTVPPLMITVAGGRLTGQSYRELTKLLSEENIGKDRQHKILIIEAVPEREGLDDKGTVTLKLDKLTDARQSDELFAGYDKSNQGKILSSFRLPPILVGFSSDHTYASSNIAQFVAEMQVFAPLRKFFDEIYNNMIVSSKFGLNLKTVMLKSCSPIISNPNDQIKAMTALNVMGGLTPRTANAAASKIMQVEIPQYPKKGEEGWEEWMDKPIMLSTGGVQKQTDAAVKDARTKQIESNGNLDVPPMHGQE